MERIILFDGVCNFCDGAVQFIIKRDPKAHFSFASLQSKPGQNLLIKWELPTDTFNSMVYVKENRVYMKSTAALKIARELKGFWPLLYVLILIPKPIRDIAYDLIAKNRYKWFGQKDECMVPSPDVRKRFLS
ncbi:thiol-disulfide oxidoreductase DCC family protein [Priestia abyssalis]|uniref:thiol-disulfide oxidoreductase DCC family protein n=1 Tax=Priestia abyssalis TaxID=1221450 RepID=UPI000994C4D9|nr:thiol-disulfide oxidoreductase DCC family protein [Priestia abyssalis]